MNIFKRLFFGTRSKRSINVIYVDMDGVIADFNKGFKSITGSEGLNAYEYENKHGKNSIWKIIDNYSKTKFFENLPWTEDGKELWKFVNKISNNVKILTALGKTDGHSSIGKKNWLNKNLPNLHDDDIVMVPNKHAKKHWATPHSIIIDDTDVVISEWKKKGGIAIHHKSTKETIKRLEEVIYE